MKKGLCLLMILALSLTMFAACDKNNQQSEEQSSEQGSEQIMIPTEPSEGLEFESYGDGTCALIGIGTCTDTYVVIPGTSPEGERVTFIEYGALRGNEELIGINIPNCVEFIGNGFISGCSNLVSITVEIGNIGNRNYYSKNNCLIEVETYGGIETYTLIAGCKTSKIPNEIEVIGDDAFSGCSSLTSIVIPYNVVEIGDYAFSGCTGLTNIEIPDGVTNIGAGAFNGCTGLTKIEIPDSVISIGDRAFAKCNALIDIVIPEGVETIGNALIQACENLKSISLPSTLLRIESESSPVRVLSGGPALESIIVAKDNPVYYSVNNCLIEKASGTMIAGCKTSKIPEGVKSIQSFAFSGCTDLKEITIPESVTNIESSVLTAGLNLTDINYVGTEDMWEAISIGIDNESLQTATIHYNYVPEE